MSRQQRVTSVAVHDMWQKIRFMKKKIRASSARKSKFFYCVFCGPWYNQTSSDGRCYPSGQINITTQDVINTTICLHINHLLYTRGAIALVFKLGRPAPSLKSIMEAGRRTASQKRLAPDQRVSGALGAFIEGPHKRRRRERLFGHIIRAVGERRYLVRFDNGEERECASNVLKVESSLASIPPDMPLPVREPIRGVVAIHEAAGDPEVQDAEETEDMPTVRPEEEDAEAAEEQSNEIEADGAEQEEENVGATTEVVAAEAVHDPNGRMPGQLPTAATAVTKDYHSVKKAAKEKISALVGTEVPVTSRKNGTIIWKVVDSHVPPEEKLISLSTICYGLKGFSLGNFKKSEVLAHLFLELTFLDWKSKVDKMNREVEASKAKCKKFSYEEFLIGLGLIIGAAEFSQKGVDLFGTKSLEDDDIDWPSISPSPQFEQFMAFSRFKDFRRFLPSIYADESKKDSDPWWEFSGAVEEFNVIRATKVISSHWISADESMCAWRPRTTALGGLPNISFVVRKPEPLGTLILIYL